MSVEQAHKSFDYVERYLEKAKDALDSGDYLHAVWCLSVAQNNAGEVIQALVEHVTGSCTGRSTDAT